MSRSSQNRTSQDRASGQERQKATLNSKFDDDYEPVRPLMEHGQQYSAESYYEDEMSGQVVAHGRAKQPLIRSMQSGSKVGYDTATGEKVFKVTTN